MKFWSRKKAHNTIEAAATITIKAAAENHRISGVAYSGGKMKLPNYFHPVVVDLGGMEIPNTVPLLTDHENRTTSRVGIITATVTDGTLTIEGEIISSTDEAKEIVEQAKAGADWQLSIGAEEKQAEEVETESREINGQMHQPPFVHVKKSELREVSVVAVGADASTSMSLAARFNLYGGNNMEFLQWLKAHGFTAAALNETDTATLMAAWKKDEEPPAGFQVTPVAPVTPTPSATPAPAVQAAATLPAAVSPVDQIRQDSAAEVTRISAIRQHSGGNHPEIEAKAIAQGWTSEKAELEIMRLEMTRAARPAAPNIKTGAGADIPTGDILAAAVMLSAKAENVETMFATPVLDAAHKRFRGRISLQELFLEAAWANGYTGHSFREIGAVLRAAFTPQIQGAGSTIDISNILSNIANKFILEGYSHVEASWRQISAIRSVNDFKTITSYRMTGANQFEQVGPDGELHNGTLSSDNFTNKAETYGKILSITRQDLVNDDLGAISDVPRMLGRGAALKINDVFWTMFLANSAFFTVGNNNLLTGAGSALGVSGLTAAKTAFSKQVDPDGKPLGVTPAIALVPTDLEVEAELLHESTEMRDTTANKKSTTKNPHAKKYRPVASAYLSNSSYPGYSLTGWYLLADPRDVATIETVFLNGVEQPTIETAATNLDTLGVQFRGFLDFGVNLQDPRGGVNSAGV